LRTEIEQILDDFIMDAKINETRQQTAEVGQMMFERYLTDTAGATSASHWGFACITLCRVCLPLADQA
jgi:hypothetical protein